MRDLHPCPHDLAAMRKGDLFQSGDTPVLVKVANFNPSKDVMTMCVEADIAPYGNQSKDTQARLADDSSASASILRSLRKLLAQGVTLPSPSPSKLHFRGVGEVVPEPSPSSSGSASTAAAVGTPAQPAIEAADVHTSGASGTPVVSVQLLNARSTTTKTLDLTGGTPTGHPTSIQGGVRLASSTPTAIDVIGTCTTGSKATTAEDAIIAGTITTSSSRRSSSSSRSVAQDGSKGKTLIKKLKHAAAAFLRGYKEGMSETSYAVASSSAMLALWPCPLPEPSCGLQFRYNPYDPYNYAREYHY